MKIETNISIKIKDTINGIGIDWNGTDTEIGKEHYECLGELDQYTKDLFTLKPFANEICKTPPMVKYKRQGTKIEK